MFKKRFASTVILSSLFIFIVLISRGPFGFIIPVIVATLNIKGLLEYFRMIKSCGLKSNPLSVCFASMVYTFLLYYFVHFKRVHSLAFLDEMLLFFIFLFLFTVQFWEWQKEKEKNSMIISLTISVTGFLYIPWCLNFIIKILYLEKMDGPMLVFFLILVTKSTDIFAYLVGRTWGKHKLAKRISPNKTQEGALGGLLGSLIMAMTAQLTFMKSSLSFSQAVILGIILSIVSQFGDLAESLLKRDTDCKDSGNIFWGMGGALDILDSILFTAPVMYFMIHLFIIGI
ncbi:MAG: phosphatidate cytidylyltransferase [Candidatus Aureabacteria bacterium]|nr:phosphatidate cytidylyltransferase [Candidatus Auribacterota bacterium]